MRKLNFILVTFILIIVLLGVEIIIVRNISKYEPQTNVVYARTKIPEKAVINADMLQEKKIDLSMVHSQSVRSIKELIGKKSRVDIEEGEMVLSGKLGPNDEMEQIKITDKNNRLFSVEFKGDQANGWWLMVDQYVDIIYVPNERMKTDNAPDVTALQEQIPDSADITQWKSPSAVKRLRNIRIAALIDEKGKLLKNTDRSTLPKYVSFEVNDSQDEFLAYAKSSGKLEISSIPGK